MTRALVEWRESALNQHPYQAVVTRRWILPDDTITILSKLRDVDLHGPETISSVVGGTEEWTLAYAADIHGVITRLDGEKHGRKLSARLSSSAAKKVRSAAWQNRIRKRYEKNAELALIAAENALEDIGKFKKVTKKEKGKLPAQRRTTTGNKEETKRMVDVHRSKLYQTLENAVQDLQRHCEWLKEVVVWSSGLAGAENNANTDEEGDEDEPGSLGKNPAFLPPPVRRTSRQSI